MRCIYCYGAYFERKLEDRPLNTWLDTIDELAAMGTRCVHLGGGEPLMRSDVYQIIARVKSHGLLCRMNSNGTLVPKMIEKIKGLDSICISLDGVGQANDINRGKGTFEKIVAGIRCAVDAGISTHISAVITKNSFKSVEHLLQLAKELGVWVEFSLPYEVSTGSDERSDLQFNDQEIRQILSELIRLRREGNPVFYSEETHQYALNWPLQYSHKIMYEDEVPQGFTPLTCFMGKTQCFVDGDGAVFPCGQVIGRFPALNLFEVGFKKAWEHLVKNKSCVSCYCLCFLEYNHVFNLKPRVLLSNAFREVKTDFVSRRNKRTLKTIK